MTDAKISQGSSGGPLLNQQGHAIGLITFQTGEDSRTAGDNFAFAIPIRLAKNLLQQNQVSNQEGNYSSRFVRGINLIDAKQCRLANEEFKAAASQSNTWFSTDRYLNPYIKKCDDLILANQSWDGSWQRLLLWLRSLGSFTWFVVAGRIVLAGFVAWIFWLIFKRMTKDEQEISELSLELEQEKQSKDELLKQLVKRGVELPMPENELHAQQRLELDIPHPHIIDFVKEARQVGLKDEHVADELLKAGWNRQEIKQALDYRESGI